MDLENNKVITYVEARNEEEAKHKFIEKLRNY